MVKKEEYYGQYRSINYCPDCDYFYKGGITPPPVVCPKCGSFIKSGIGRYLLSKTKTWLSTVISVIGYKLKDDPQRYNFEDVEKWLDEKGFKVVLKLEVK